MVEVVRRYSRQAHLWRTSKRLAKLLAAPPGQASRAMPPRPHIHKLRQRLDGETVERLAQDYRAGTSLAELQQKYSLGRGSLQRLLREAGVRQRRKSLTTDEVAMLVKRYKTGLTIREIAAEQGVAKTTAQNALARSGVEMRPGVRRPRTDLS